MLQGAVQVASSKEPVTHLGAMLQTVAALQLRSASEMLLLCGN